MKVIKQHLQDQFGAELISFVCEDGVLLYANYMPPFANNALDDLTVRELVTMAGEDCTTGRYIDLRVYCEDGTGGGGEVRLPAIRVRKV